MKTKTYQVYTFDELSDKAKQRAIAKHREFIGNDQWHESTIDDAKNILAHCGLAIDKIYFSGFSSQGDGACFEGKWDAKDVDAKAMEAETSDAELNRIARQFSEIAALYPCAGFSVKHRGHYSHQYCTDFTVWMPDENSDEIKGEDRDKEEKNLIKLARDAMAWIYCQLEKEYDYQTADEQIIENIEANGYEFTAEGNLD